MSPDVSKRCRLCEKMQPCPEHGRTPVTRADFEELSRDVAQMLAENEEDGLVTPDGMTISDVLEKYPPCTPRSRRPS